MSDRLLIDAICDLTLPPARATDDEIRGLLADSELGDWYEYADSIWSANSIAESLLVTRRKLKHSERSTSAEARFLASQPKDTRDLRTRFEDLLDQHFAYWAVTAFLAGMAAGVLG